MIKQDSKTVIQNGMAVFFCVHFLFLRTLPEFYADNTQIFRTWCSIEIYGSNTEE